jgi:plasmid stabilization system protein ParE
MDQKQIIWSHRAEEELYSILEFYITRNKSATYSKKLLSSVEKLIDLLPKNKYLGRLSENGFTRVIVKKEFLIFYEVYKDAIVIVSFWDNRQDTTKRIDTE